MKTDRFEKLLGFLERLQKSKLHYTVSHHREEAISVEVHMPGEHWEVDFLADGDIDVERYRSTGEMHDEAVLEELFAEDSSSDATAPAKKQHDAIARK